MIEGSYDLNGQRMQSYNRVVIATGTPVRPNLPGQQYLIQLTVTGFADQAAGGGTRYRGDHQGIHRSGQIAVGNVTRDRWIRSLRTLG